MRSLAILNPVAGRGRAVPVWQRVRAELDIARAWECVETRRPGHARELAQSAGASGYHRVLAVGGDGTFCEVANGLVHSDTALCMIPVGTGNDTARNLRIPTDALSAARLAATGAVHTIDLGLVQTVGGSRYFINIAGFGFDAEVAWRVNRSPRPIGGPLAYVVGTLQTLWRYRSPRMRICVDQRQIDRNIFMVAVANGASYGGGMRIAPPALPDDGVLDVCVVTGLHPLRVLRLVPKMYSGGHVNHPAVELARCFEVTATSESAVRCHADGELVGELLPASP